MRAAILIAAVIAGAVGATVATGGATAQSEPGNVRGKPKSYLFVQNASAGSMTRIRGSRGLYRLRLRGVDPHAAFFSDRPARTTGVLRHGALHRALFRPGLAAPNAAVVLVGAHSRQDTLAVRLTRPRYNPRARTLAYVARPLRSVTRGLRHLDDRLDRRLPRRFGAASLFIDSGTSFGHACVINLRNQTPYAFDPISADKWDTDDWDTNANNSYIDANGSWETAGSDHGGLLRGCHFSVTYELAGTRGDTVTVSVTNPYGGSPSWDCVPADRTKYYCDLDDGQSTLSGIILDVYWTIRRTT